MSPPCATEGLAVNLRCHLCYGGLGCELVAPPVLPRAWLSGPYPSDGSGDVEMFENVENSMLSCPYPFGILEM